LRKHFTRQELIARSDTPIRGITRRERPSKNTVVQDGPQSSFQGEPEYIPITDDYQKQQLTCLQLNNPDLFKDKSLVNGEWVEAKSGKRFDVVGEIPPKLIQHQHNQLITQTDPGNGKVWATAPDNVAEDTDAAVTAAHEAFETFRKVSPRTRAQCLLKWDSLIRENRDDLANIVTYEIMLWASLGGSPARPSVCRERFRCLLLLADGCLRSSSRLVLLLRWFRGISLVCELRMCV
jgi:hypothetical protein